MMARLTVCLQATETECGLGAMVSLFSAYGHHRSIRELREVSPVGRDGASLLQLKRLAQQEGFSAKGWAVHNPDLSALPVPCIALWDGAHFVVVEKVHNNRVDVVDPAVGRTSLSHEEFREHADGVVLTIAPEEGFVPQPRSSNGLARFVAPFLPKRALPLVGLVAASLTLAGMGVFGTMVTRWAIDVLAPSNDPSAPAVVLLAGVAVGLPYIALSILRYETLLWLEKYLDAAMILRVFEHLLRLPFSYFQHRPIGDLLVRLGSVNFIRDTLSGRLFPIAIDLVFLVFYLAVLGLFDLRFVAVVGILIVANAVVLCIVAPRARRLTDREIQENAHSQGVLLESLSNIETIKSFGGEPHAIGRYKEVYAKQLTWSVKRTRLDNSISSWFDAVSFLNPIVILGVGLWLLMSSQLTLGTMVAALTIASSALAPVRSIGMNLQAILTVGVHLGRLQDIMDEAPEALGENLETIDFKGAVELANYSYRYGAAREMTLKSINVSVNKGEFVAIVGRSGSGKSTLARAIVGLLNPEGGVITYDGHPAHTINMRSIRSKVGIVTQNSAGIAASIEDNIRFGRDISLEDVVNASRGAQLHDDVVAMGLGYHTPLGESGAGLSGGQIQRLSIARALAGSPSLLVLDEATSHLDAVTEAAVSNNIAELGITRVVIAHRMSTILQADRIVVMDKGQIIAQGAHSDLLAEPLYVELMNAQFAQH